MSLISTKIHLEAHSFHLLLILYICISLSFPGRDMYLCFVSLLKMHWAPPMATHGVPRVRVSPPLSLVSWRRRVAPEGSSIPFLGQDQPQLSSCACLPSPLSIVSWGWDFCWTLSLHDWEVLGLGVDGCLGHLWAWWLSWRIPPLLHNRQISYPQLPSKRKLCAAHFPGPFWASPCLPPARPVSFSR